MAGAFEVDASQFEAFAAKGAGIIGDRMRGRYLERAGQIVRSHQILEASRRLGVEQAESQMVSRDPGRPKGLYSNSIAPVVTQDHVDVGPNRIYSWWVEQGSKAPRGVPKSHRESRFIGHRIVERGGQAAVPDLQVAAEDEMDAALDAAVRGAGGR